MRSRLLLIPAILATTAGLGVSGNAISSQSDAQAQAAALLSPPHASISEGVRDDSDASQQTAALDAQAQAATLLSGARITVGESARTTAASEKLGEHPAVVVAQTWSTRGIDPNTFIVAHPARLQLIAASPTDKDPQRAEAEATASTR